MADLVVWRKRKGVSLSAIAEATKISVRYLEAIENRNYRDLPGGVYSISYIRQYAEAIGYDADALVESFLRTTQPKKAPAPTPESRSGWLSRAWRRIRPFRGTAWHGTVTDVRE